MNLKYAKMLAIVVHEKNETWRQYPEESEPLTCKHKFTNKILANLQISLKLDEHQGRHWRKSSRERLWKNSSQCRDILLQVK